MVSLDASTIQAKVREYRESMIKEQSAKLGDSM